MLKSNEVVPLHDCVAELWGSDPPRTAVSTVQTYVLQIRQTLRERADDAGQVDRLQSRRQSYRFVTDTNDLDRARFEMYTQLGREAAESGDDRRASHLLEQALALWRGPVVSDVQTGAMAAGFVVELEERRTYVHQMRIDADLRLGRDAAVLDELRDLVRRYPEHEDFREKLMIVLCRSGRRRAALELFERRRRTLLTELGMEPGRRITRTYRSILLGDDLELCETRSRRAVPHVVGA